MQKLGSSSVELVSTATEEEGVKEEEVGEGEGAAFPKGLLYVTYTSVSAALLPPVTLLLMIINNYN